MRVVLDTNVVASAYISPTGPPALVRLAWERRQFDLLVSSAILAEYDRVLRYPRLVARHRMSNQEITKVIDDIRQLATMIHVASELALVPDDPSDSKFIECAVDGGAEIIVSGDRHLLGVGSFRGIQILPPEAFLVLLAL